MLLSSVKGISKKKRYFLYVNTSTLMTFFFMYFRVIFLLSSGLSSWWEIYNCYLSSSFPNMPFFPFLKCQLFLRSPFFLSQVFIKLIIMCFWCHCLYLSCLAFEISGFVGLYFLIKLEKCSVISSDNCSSVSTPFLELQRNKPQTADSHPMVHKILFSFFSLFCCCSFCLSFWIASVALSSY